MKKLMIVIMISLISVSCANKPPSALTGGPKMSEVLGGTSGDNFRSEYRPARISDENNMHDYTRTAQNETNHLFPRLPNPDICMFVTPHMSEESTPVPGYTTCFAMFDKNQYALPGEINASY